MRTDPDIEAVGTIYLPDLRRPGPKSVLERDFEWTIWSMFKLGKLDVTQQELAHYFGVDRATVNRFFRKYPEAVEAFERGRAMGCISLRRAQQRSALRGNVQAQIWLGKQRLGQRDKHDLNMNMVSHEEALAALA